MLVLVLVLVLVLERCCLQKRRVNPIRSAFAEFHPRSGLKVLVRRFVLVVPPRIRPPGMMWSRFRGQRLMDRVPEGIVDLCPEGTSDRSQAINCLATII